MIVVNTTVLSNLARVDRLGILKELYGKMVIPIRISRRRSNEHIGPKAKHSLRRISIFDGLSFTLFKGLGVHKALLVSTRVFRSERAPI